MTPFPEKSDADQDSIKEVVDSEHKDSLVSHVDEPFPAQASGDDVSNNSCDEDPSNEESIEEIPDADLELMVPLAAIKVIGIAVEQSAINLLTIATASHLCHEVLNDNTKKTNLEFISCKKRQSLILSVTYLA